MVSLTQSRGAAEERRGKTEESHKCILCISASKSKGFDESALIQSAEIRPIRVIRVLFQLAERVASWSV